MAHITITTSAVPGQSSAVTPGGALTSPPPEPVGWVICRAAKDRTVTPKELQTLKTVVQSRLLTLAAVNAQVATEGDKALRITVFDRSPDQVRRACETMRMQLRPVVERITPTVPSPANQPSSATGNEIPLPVTPTPPAECTAALSLNQQRLTACDAQRIAYVMEAPVADEIDVKSVVARPHQGNWSVNVTINEAAMGRINALIGTGVNPSEGRYLAFVNEGGVVIVPMFRDSIPSPELMITGEYTEPQAQQLAAQIMPKLPVPLPIIESTTITRG